MKDDSFDPGEISTKHLPLRIAAFVLAFAVAVGAFVISVKQRSGNEAGYAVVSARANGDVPLYAANIQLTYRFEGSSRSIRLMKNEISNCYSNALAYIYKLLDAGKEYPGYAGNLAELNRRLNEDVAVSQELFDVLSDALERSDREEGYSIYAGPLYAEWESVTYTSDPENIDPFVNPDERERLETIARRCVRPTECRLEIVDREQRLVRLNVEQSYLDFRREYELRSPILDLNLMKDAYLLRYVGDTLELRGFTNGFLATRSGLSRSLSGDSGGQYAVYSYVNHTAVTAASVPAAAGTVGSLIRAFPLTDDEGGYYDLSGILRGPYILPGADFAEAAARAVWIMRRGGDEVEACCESLRLAAQASAGRIAEAAAESGADLIVWIASDGDGRELHAAGPEVSELQAAEGFRIVTDAGE